MGFGGFLFFLFRPWPDRPLSGGAGFEGFYQNEGQRGFGRGWFVLNPSLSVLDGLSIQTRLELYSSKTDPLLLSSKDSERSFGLPYFYMSRGKMKNVSLSPLLFKVQRFYINYETEFFILQAGRSGRHFGLGATYNDTKDLSLKHWSSAVQQLFFYTEYGPFHIEPALILHPEKHASLLLQGGIQKRFGKRRVFTVMTPPPLPGLWRFLENIRKNF